jgi:hypothetical protein
MYIDKIKILCEPYIRELRNGDNPHALLRGSRSSHIKLKRNVRENRKPKNTPIQYHNAADDWFYEQFGIRYRSDALFCTGSFNGAALYGNVFIIFPIGEFKVCWSPNIVDMYFEFLRDSYGDVKTFVGRLMRANYMEGQLNNAIEKGHEIMLYCDSYYQIPVRDESEMSSFITEILHC